MVVVWLDRAEVSRLNERNVRDLTPVRVVVVRVGRRGGGASYGRATAVVPSSLPESYFSRLAVRCDWGSLRNVPS